MIDGTCVPVKEEIAKPHAEGVAKWDSFYHCTEWQHYAPAMTRHVGSRDTHKKSSMAPTFLMQNYFLLNVKQLRVIITL